MKPTITFLTSSELQHVLGNPLDEEEQEELQRFRDRVMQTFSEYEDALQRMEVLYGRKWRQFDVSIWVFDGAMDSISSPILIRKEHQEEAVFAAFQLLAKQLIRSNPPDSGLVAPGYDGLEAVSALLAQTALEQEAVDDAFLDRVRENSDEVKQWRAVDTYAEQWDTDSPLYDWLEERG